LRERAARDRREFHAVSSAANKGVRELVHAVGRRLDELKESEGAAVELEAEWPGAGEASPFGRAD
jgi:hypothetical protein